MSEKLHETRLATTDETGHRVYLHPEDVKGKWTNRRKLFYWFLILIYLVVPWIYIDGKQWVLLNLPGREFRIFGEVFYGHDGPLLIFIFLLFLFGIGFITSIWGRVWCGWACPQTVFIDTIYRKVELLVEGKSRARKKLDKAPWNLEKITKRAIKWTLFTIVSLHIAHSFLGYFVGTRRLVEISMQSPFENLELFITMLILTGITLFDFGWFREQFCIIACPYGRFQSVLMDENSMVVAYDKERGEPRRSKGLAKEDEGDCIDCDHCVKACPTGIDIRRGTQLECIACTMCIDACDEIMTKVKRPTGLIKYTTENELDHRPKQTTIRSYIYLLAIIAVLSGLVYSLNHRKDLKIKLLRAQGTTYQEITEADNKLILNQYRLLVHAYGSTGFQLKLRPVNNDFEIVSGQLPFTIENNLDEVNFFIKAPKKLFNSGSYKSSIQIELYNKNKKTEELTKEVKLVGPFN